MSFDGERDDRLRSSGLDDVNLGLKADRALPLDNCDVFWTDRKRQWAIPTLKAGRDGNDSILEAHNPLAPDSHKGSVKEIDPGIADEFSDEEVGGIVIDIVGRALLLDGAALHHNDDVRHGQRLD